MKTTTQEWGGWECRRYRIRKHPRTVRVCAFMRLNRRVPNGTYGGVRGRLGDQLLLDLYIRLRNRSLGFISFRLVSAWSLRNCFFAVELHFSEECSIIYPEKDFFRSLAYLRNSTTGFRHGFLNLRIWRK